MHRGAVRSAIAGIVLALAGTAGAQAIFPGKPVRLIVPYAPGGGTSVGSRLLGQKLGDLWKYQVIVDNRPGGNTIIGSELMVKSPPDGHTLLFVTSTHTINPALLKTPYDAIRDFAAVSTVSRSPFMLVVHPSLPVNNLREFIALARSRPGQLDYATSGTATAPHLALEVFSLAAGIRMHHIPYKGGGPALVDLIGGQVQVHMTAPVNLVPNVRNGRLKGLAVTGENRLAALPELPTFTEAGLPGFNLSNWNGVLAPADTPKALVDRIAADIGSVLRMPDIGERFVAQGQNAWVLGPEQFSALIRSEIDTFARVVKAVGITIN